MPEQPRTERKRITLTVRPRADATKRAEVIHEWHKSLLHEVVPTLIQKWESKLNELPLSAEVWRA